MLGLGLARELAGGGRGVTLESEIVGRKRRRRGKGRGLGGIRLEYWLFESWSLHLGEGGADQAEGREEGVDGHQIVQRDVHVLPPGGRDQHSHSL